MKTITMDWLLQKGKELYGENRLDWKFKCPHCKSVQSGNSIIQQMKEGIGSQRHGILKKGDSLKPETQCYSPECNWLANGLFNSGLLLIIDPKKPHDANLKENCYYVFPFADE